MDVIISPQGGHGTSFVMNHFEPPPLKRPDVVFGKEYDLDGPVDADIKAWRQRSAGAPLFDTPGKSLFHLIQASRRPVLLSGRCSIRQAFLTRYGIKAVAIVRHPLHAYVSFMSHQHPNHAEEFGGFNTIGAVRQWLRWWRPVVLDIIIANATIIRFEHAAKDAQQLPLN
jgi:hypothetical protein